MFIYIPCFTGMNLSTKLTKIHLLLRPLQIRFISNIGKFKKLAKKNPYRNTIIACTIAGISTIDIEETTDYKNGNEVAPNHLDLIKGISSINASNIKEFMETLESVILQTCEKYRYCLDQQVKIMEDMIKVSNLDIFWDELLKFRAEGKQLKEELLLYESLVKHIGEIAYNIDMCSTILKIDEECLYTYYKQLKILSEQELAINKTIEDKWLKVSVENILNSESA